MAQFQLGDVVKAGNQFAGTVVAIDGETVVVEDRDGDRREFVAGDLKETA